MARHSARPKTRKAKITEAVKAARGADRSAHFAEGKTARMWGHPPTTTRNQRRDANRDACRGRVSDW